MTTTTEAEYLAHRFAALLEAWLTPAEFAEMQRRNTRDPRYIGLCCASHDFCDANMAMGAAWRAVRGESIDADNEAQAALWNEAWDIARALYLSEAHALEPCQHRDDGRGQCIDCGTFLPNTDGTYWGADGRISTREMGD